jgi:cardiolipin synthase A/B
LTTTPGARPFHPARGAALPGRARPAIRRAQCATVAAALCAGLAACSAPHVGRLINQPPAAGPPQLMSASGPLSEADSARILGRLERKVRDSDMLQRHLAIEQAVAETPLVVGNRTLVLPTGEAAFRAMFAAMRAAMHHINLEYYVVENVESDGQSLLDLLLQKRKEGVAVNIMYDSYGSLDTPGKFFDALRKAGVNLLQFHPVNPFEARTGYSLNDRDHRKILVVDGATAIVGGVNLSTVYQHHGFGTSIGIGSGGGDSARGASPNTGHRLQWLDTDLEIQGPVVAQLQQLFLDHWREQDGPALTDADFFPKIAPAGKEIVRIIGSTPDDGVPRYYVTLLSAIRTAEKSVWITAAYFVPTHREMADLIDAARRGVDVRLLLPGTSDSDLAQAVARSRYEDLLEAGVKIYETRNEMLHSKMVTIDGAWSVIGSSNFDYRSVLWNDEVDAVVLGGDTARQCRQVFEDDLTRADRITLDAWRARRTLVDKIHDDALRLWQSLY